MVKNFIPVALDSYFRGDSQELEFCKVVGAGGNHLAAVTAGGRKLGGEKHLKLRERELAPVLAEYRALPEADRKPALPDAKEAIAPKRPVPPPPPGGLVLRGYCTYMKADAQGKTVKSREYYYRENPDRWMTETQSDLVWLTEAEWRSLIPQNAKKGDPVQVLRPIQERFFCTIGIDYMEGSVNALAARETKMTLTVENAAPDRVTLRLDGGAKLGKELGETTKKEKSTRGCEVRVLGWVEYDVAKKAIDRFDVVGLGKAWGNKMDYVHREIRIDDYPWMYGIAVELVKGRSPADLIPPYNMLHYGGAIQYFGKK